MGGARLELHVHLWTRIAVFSLPAGRWRARVRVWARVRVCTWVWVCAWQDSQDSHPRDSRSRVARRLRVPALHRLASAPAVMTVSVMRIKGG